MIAVIPRSAVINIVYLFVGFVNEVVHETVIDGGGKDIFVRIGQFEVIRESRFQKWISGVIRVSIHWISKRIHILIIRIIDSSSERQANLMLFQTVRIIGKISRRKQAVVHPCETRICDQWVA
ncbi:hypothetical protein D3C80_1032070 [compost metagenome]